MTQSRPVFLAGLSDITLEFVHDRCEWILGSYAEDDPAREEWQAYLDDVTAELEKRTVAA